MNLFLILMTAFTVQAAPNPKAVTPERFKQFPLTTIRQHRATLLPEEFATARHLINRDPRALSWSFNLFYQGEVQPISGARKELVDFVVKNNPQLKDRYQYEILVSDGEEKFWLPIQNDILAQFKREIKKKGEPIYAHTRYFGSYYEGVPKQFFLMLGYRRNVNMFKSFQ